MFIGLSDRVAPILAKLRIFINEIVIPNEDRYLEELEWRFNNRENPHIFRDTLRRIVDTDALTYETLTA